MEKKKPSIWWIRRDLRLHDNEALYMAAHGGGGVIPLFILDPALLDIRSSNAVEGQKAFLFGGLRALHADLRDRDSRLIVREGKPERVLLEIVREAAAGTIFAEEDYTPYARRRDAAVGGLLPLRLVKGVNVHCPTEIHKQDGGPYTVFTAFCRAWKILAPPVASDLKPTPRKINPPPGDLRSVDIPELPLPEFLPPGEAEAHRRFRAFVRGPIFRYAAVRDCLALDGTSMLSPYFRFGMLSAREAMAVAQSLATNAPAGSAGRKGAETWINELIWREFYMSVLHHFPQVLETAFNPALRNIKWRLDPAQLGAWQQGQTGFPVVDAGMRQLLVTGWMHNRARMIVASFLVKDLLINWQEGEHWFMRHLIDGDLAANSGGWQWCAGVGTDAAPYFRIFNPVLQSRKFDPEGLYIRRWVPELADVPAKYIHEPHLMPPAVQKKSGCIIGRNYPAPIVDRKVARERVLAAYKMAAGRIKDTMRRRILPENSGRF